jgi:hypothetical protein
MNGGIIKANHARAGKDGGGVQVEEGTFTMNGGTISDNTAEETGGGVHLRNGTFTMSGGTISRNAAPFGGGVGIDIRDAGTFTMSGGTISRNTAELFGGGVGVVKGAFTMEEGGTISGNIAHFGVGVGIFADETVTFIKTGGIIYGDTDATHTGSTENTATSAASGKGHAVAAMTYSGPNNVEVDEMKPYIGVPKYRDTTSGPNDDMDSSTEENWTEN